jgi:leucyl aminopeptidase
MQLIAATDTPQLQRAASLARSAAAFDAIALLIPANLAKPDFALLPDVAQWRALHARERPQSGQVRSCTLADAGQTAAVVGYLSADASPFEQLALAGRVLREALARHPQRLAVGWLGQDKAAPGPLQALLSAALAQDFALPSYRSKPGLNQRLKRVVVLGGDTLNLQHIASIARAQNLARWLTALPPNKLDAKAYRRLLTQLARKHGLRLRWWDENALRRAGAGAFLAVAAGNARRDAAGIAHLSYRPARRAKGPPDIALVGKGILFDTGGTNLKPHRSMLDMHTDMAGSAVALATLLALAEQRSPIAADAWLAITENRIGPTAYQPQDIVRAANGTTIQVIHTDAEGRMALADTLVLAGRSKPKLMIDFATLTGACVYALTERMSGVFCSDDRLVAPLISAGRNSGDRVVYFPMYADFDADLESKVADVVQCAVDGKGDHILAARFLLRFVPEKMPWVHVDLSSATRSGGLAHVTTDVTGFGVRLALELLQGQDVLKALRTA